MILFNLNNKGFFLQILLWFSLFSFLNGFFQRQSSLLRLAHSFSSYIRTQALGTISDGSEILGHVDVKITSLNVLAPCYNKIFIDGSNAAIEANDPSRFIARHQSICAKLLECNSDVICLQEFWVSNADLQKVYETTLCDQGGYVMKSIRRTSHWGEREDGLAIFVRNSSIEIQDVQNILFHDCGDRVALLLLLAIRPTIPNALPQQFIVINTHLLFPHNSYSTNIRLREATKILGFVELYRQRELCTTICNRADVRLPVIVAGDFNGSPRGKVHKFIVSQNFRSAVDEGMLSTNRTKWITHKSHRKQLVPVDHIFYCNPSEQTTDNLPPVPDWTNLVFREVFQTICDRYGADSVREAFFDFDMSGSAYVDRDKFREALNELGFIGEGKPSLTPEEIEVLVDSADVNGDGRIDFKEFTDRFSLATRNDDVGNPMREYFLRSQWLNQETSIPELDFEFINPRISVDDNSIQITGGGPFIESSVPVYAVHNNLVESLTSSRPLGDLKLVKTTIYPEQLEKGEWPSDYTMSDHGIVHVLFSAQVLGPVPDEEVINPMPLARKRVNPIELVN